MKCKNCGKEIGDSWLGGLEHDHFITRELKEINYCPFCGYKLIPPTKIIIDDDICISCFYKKNPFTPKEILYKDYYDKLVE